jgi:uncharacterized protein YndB with AHSA1/START domain
MARVDSASRLIAAPPERIYRAFVEPGAMERWLPPSGMTGKMLHFDFREGGSYRMRLTYKAPQSGGGKTSDSSDEVAVHLVRLDKGKTIEQDVQFESEDAVFSGVMRMVWTFQTEEGETRVTVCAENVPSGISSEDHQAGMNSTLENLANFVEVQNG